jgi:hypothetical protein
VFLLISFDLIFNMPNVHEISPLETLGQKVIPAVAEL